MSVLYIMLPVALLIASGAVWAFIIAARAGQMDDLETPAYRMLVDDEDGVPATQPDEPTQTPGPRPDRALNQVERRRVELPTSSLRTTRSTN